MVLRTERARPRPLTGVMVGAGYFSGHQLEAWSRIAGVQIVGIADLDASRARAQARRWGVPRVYEAADAMLAEARPDFVDIVTPPAAHLRLVRLAARHGAAVLCQKPLAPSFADARRLIRFCQDRDVRLMVNENWRWQAWFREVRRLLDRGAVGTPINLYFHLRTHDGAGPRPYQRHPYFLTKRRFLLEETVVHFLDTFRFLAGEIESVYCVTRRLNSRTRGEDTVNVLCRFATGTLGVIDANRTIPALTERRTFGTFRLEGDRGVLEIHDTGRIRRIDPQGRAVWHRYPVPRRGYFGDGCRFAQQHFVDMLRSGGPFETDGHSYLPTLAAVEAGYRSARLGRPVAVGRLLRG